MGSARLGTRLPLRRAVQSLAALVVAVVLVWWGVEEGGYEPADWLPIGILVALATAVVVLADDRLAPLRRPALVALGAFAGYVVWSYASILWADDQGAAWEGSHRTLLYFACFALAAVIPWSARSALNAVTGATLLVGAIAVITLLRLLLADDPVSLFSEGRLNTPIGYQNANAALFTLAAAPAVVLGGRREVDPALRPVLMASAVVLLGMAVLSQSRGWVVSLPVIALATLLLAPGRVRLLLWAIPPFVAVGALLPAALDVYASGGGWQPDLAALADDADGAGGAIAGAASATLLVGSLLVVLDARVRPSARVERMSGRVAAVLGVLVLVGGLGAGYAATDGDPGKKLDRAWESFSNEDADADEGESRFSSLGSTRYDFYRVGWRVFRDAPVGGLGQDNFAQAYLLERRVEREEPRWAHSLELRLLVHTGVIGFLLALAVIVAAAIAGRCAARTSPPARLTVAVLALPLVVWAAHGSVDWLWEFPLLSCIALALLGALTALDRPPAAVVEGPRRRSPGRIAAVAVTGAFALFAVVALGMSWLSVRNVNTALEEWRSDPATAYERLDRAASLNPFATSPSIVAGTVAAARRDYGRAERLYAKAAERDPHDWFVHFRIGLLAGARGDRTSAEFQLVQAQRLNPRDPLVHRARVRLREGRPLGFTEAQREFRRRVQRRLGQN